MLIQRAIGLGNIHPPDQHQGYMCCKIIIILTTKFDHRHLSYFSFIKRQNVQTLFQFCLFGSRSSAPAPLQNVLAPSSWKHRAASTARSALQRKIWHKGRLSQKAGKAGFVHFGNLSNSGVWGYAEHKQGQRQKRQLFLIAPRRPCPSMEVEKVLLHTLWKEICDRKLSLRTLSLQCSPFSGKHFLTFL